MRRALLMAMAVASFALAGCKSGHMMRAEAGYAPAPSEDRAGVVFMRPSGFGYAIQSSVWDVTEGEPEFIGIVSSKTKVFYEAPKGERLFMVVAENADFLGAELDAGRMYHVVVSPRMGMWKARFSLLPVRQEELDSSTFRGWQSSTKWYVKDETADAWAASNLASVRNKLEAYLPKWEAKSEEAKAERSLTTADGE